MPRGYRPADVKKRKEVFLQAYQNTLCNVSAACEQIGISRSVVYKWEKEDPEFFKVMQQLEDYQVDFVEHQLMASIKAGSVQAQIFYLKTKGKHRGYVERTEVTGAGGRPLGEGVNETVERVLMNMTPSQMAEIAREIDHDTTLRS